MEIDDKTAIVTGASRGLGSAAAAALIEKGAEVYGLARSQNALDELKDKLGADFHPVPMDITDEKGIDAWFNNEFSEQNPPEILVNNAGVGGFVSLDEMSSEEWTTMVNTNLNGMYFITSRVAALMKKHEGTTHIVNIGSILGTMARKDAAAYCTTKYGISGFSEALFKELRFFDIKVTCLNPGSIDTEFFESSGIESHSNMLQPKDLADTLVHVLETPPNMLINEMTIRPLNPKKPN